jgi:hypothetical protein
MENNIQTQDTLQSNVGQYEPEVQFLGKFRDSAFFGG